MNLLQGDHTAAVTPLENVVLATLGSHEVGNPWMTLPRGSMYDPYCFRTRDVLGEKGRAEWYICGADVLMTSKKPVTNRKQSFARQ